MLHWLFNTMSLILDEKNKTKKSKQEGRKLRIFSFGKQTIIERLLYEVWD